MKMKNTLTLFTLLFCFNITAQDWAWIGGTQNNGDSGNYGTIGVPAPTNIPPGIDDFASIKKNDSTLYVFGGLQNADFFHDLWSYNSLTNEWTWISGTQAVNVAGAYGTQGVASPSNFPGSRRRTATTFDSNGNYWVFGGDGYDSNGDIGLLNDLWKFDPSTGEWTWMSGSNLRNSAGSYGTINVTSPTNQPPSRYWSEMWFHNDRLYLFGGVSSGGNRNDVWYFDLTTEEWVWVKGSNGLNTPGVYGTINTPAASNDIGARNSFALTPLNTGDSVYVFGGFGTDVNGNGGVLNDMWIYVASNNEWTWVNGDNVRNAISTYGVQGVFDAANTPGARRYVAPANRGDSLIYFYGGFGKQMTTTNADVSELWVFDPSNNQWAFLEGSTFGSNGLNYGTLGVPGPSVNPGARKYGSLTFLAPKRLIAFGGRNDGNHFKNDLFQKDYCELDFGSLNFSPISCNREADGVMEITPINNLGPVTYSSDDMNYTSNNIFTSLDTGSYVFYIKDEFGCTNQADFVIDEPDTLIGNIVINQNILCFGGMADVEMQVNGGTPQYSYSEDNQSFLTVNNFTPSVGTHTFYVVDANGCLDSAEVTLSEPNELLLEIEIVDSMLCNGDLASVDLTATGGTGAYVFSNDGINYGGNTTFINIPQGTFTYYVKDDNDCITSAVETFVNPAPIVIAGVASDEQQGNDGSINISVGGGTAPYDYSWSNGEATEDISNLSAGTYTITITDDNGCTEDEVFEVVSFVGLDQLALKEVRLYPNPSVDYFELHFKTTASKTIRITDAAGKVLESYESDELQLNVNHQLSAGSYYIVIDAGGSREVYPFIVK